MSALKTRAQARATGSTRYFTGEPCKRGHIAERNTCDAGCVVCKKTRKPLTPKLGVRESLRRATALRAEARGAGVPRYYTGVPCTKGHLAERLTCNAQCAKCLEISNRARYAKADALDGAEAERLYVHEGLFMQQVAEAMGSTVKVVSAALKARGIRARKPSYNPISQGAPSGFPRLNLTESEIRAQYEGQRYEDIRLKQKTPRPSVDEPRRFP